VIGLCVWLCSSVQGHKEWINEVNFLGVVNHPNLVKLVGYCADDDERGMQRLLVYELMCNKSLEDHLVGRVDLPYTVVWKLSDTVMGREAIWSGIERIKQRDDRTPDKRTG